MATKVLRGALSPTMEEGRLVKWLKNEGDAVKSGEPLAEVETDKAIMELVARGDGVLRKRLVAAGESRPVGPLVGVIATADENIDALIAGSGAPAAGSSQPQEPAVAQAGGGSAGAAAEPSAPPQEKPPAASAAPAPSAPPQPAAASSGGNGGQVRSSPLARRLATERGVDLGQLQ